MVSAIQLHSALDLKCRSICRVARNSYEYKSFLVWGDLIVNDLGTGQCGMVVKDFLGRGCPVCDSPVINRYVSNHSDCCFGDPFPKYNVLIVDMRF